MKKRRIDEAEKDREGEREESEELYNGNIGNEVCWRGSGQTMESRVELWWLTEIDAFNLSNLHTLSGKPWLFTGHTASSDCDYNIHSSLPLFTILTLTIIKLVGNCYDVCFIVMYATNGILNVTAKWYDFFPHSIQLKHCLIGYKKYMAKVIIPFPALITTFITVFLDIRSLNGFEYKQRMELYVSTIFHFQSFSPYNVVKPLGSQNISILL